MEICLNVPPSFWTMTCGHQRICKCRYTFESMVNLWWRHQMETFSAVLAFCVGNSPVTGEFPSERPVTRNFMFSLICAWTNGLVNNGDVGDLRHHRAHYDVTVIFRHLTVKVICGHSSSSFVSLNLNKICTCTCRVLCNAIMTRWNVYKEIIYTCQEICRPCRHMRSRYYIFMF